MTQLIKEKSTNDIHYLSLPHDVKISNDDKKRLFELGFWEGDNNDALENELTTEELQQASEILSGYYRIDRYHQWFCKSIGKWRIVFGIKKESK